MRLALMSFSKMSHTFLHHSQEVFHLLALPWLLIKLMRLPSASAELWVSCQFTNVNMLTQYIKWWTYSTSKHTLHLNGVMLTRFMRRVHLNNMSVEVQAHKLYVLSDISEVAKACEPHIFSWWYIYSNFDMSEKHVDIFNISSFFIPVHSLNWVTL